MRFAPIVLLTDFGHQDPYVGVMKGVICTIHTGALVVDLCHEVEAQNVRQGALFLEMSYSFFPRGSIFVCVVDPGVGTKRRILCVKSRDYFFIGPDNGILSLALKQLASVIIRSCENSIFFRSADSTSTFQGRDRMAPLAAYLSLKGSSLFNRLGPLVRSVVPMDRGTLKTDRREIQGEILYFDRFGNGMTNINKRDRGLAFWSASKVSVRGKDIGSIESAYQAGAAKLKALWNSWNQLEITLPKGSAQDSARLKVGDKVCVGGVQ